MHKTLTLVSFKLVCHDHVLLDTMKDGRAMQATPEFTGMANMKTIGQIHPLEGWNPAHKPLALSYLVLPSPPLLHQNFRLPQSSVFPWMFKVQLLVLATGKAGKSTHSKKL